ncbi:MAG: DUF3047 domain-containing protein [Methylococcaceae bacterium]
MFVKQQVQDYFLVLCLLMYYPNTMAEPISNNKLVIDDFSNKSLVDWETKSFEGNTQYQVVKIGDNDVLQASSQSSASGLFKTIEVDLVKYPYLNWRWRVDKPLSVFNEMEKAGDDYAARLYIIISGGWAFWKTRAINYVWASQAKVGDSWPNAFTGENAMMLALRSNTDKTATWFAEKRNLRADLKQLLGKDYLSIDAVAIMTDTDNTKGSAIAYYDEIFFSRQ